VVQTGKYNGYNPLLVEVVKFFQTGIPPVAPEETIEIFAFMTAASESRKLNGAEVLIQSVIKEAEQEAAEKMKNYSY
jgi:hypothetical protein